MIDDQQLREMLRRLDEAVPPPPESGDDFEREKRTAPSSEPKVYISLVTEDRNGEPLGPDPWLKIAANRAGYLRLAVEFLKAAIEPTLANSKVPLRWGDLLAKDSIQVISLIRKEEGIEYPPTPDAPTRFERIKEISVLVLVLLLLLLFAVSAMAGCGTVLHWFSAPKLP